MREAGYCTWTGEFGRNGETLVAHVERCPMRLTRCEDCKELLLRGEIDEHGEQGCPERRVRCIGCGGEFRLGFLW